MKHRLIIFAAFAAALVTAAGCRMEEPEQDGKSNAPKEEVYQVHFVAEQIETKTIFGEPGEDNSYPTLWSGNEDKIAVSLNLNGVKGATVNASDDGKKADFDAEFESTSQGPYVFYALSPFSASVGATSSHGGYHLNIPAEQTPLATSCDEAAQVIAARQEAQSTAEFANIEFTFTHVTAYGKLKLTNMALKEGETIQSIDLTSSTPFSGQFYYNYDEDALSESSSSRTVSLRADNLEFTGKNSPVVYDSSDIWFACAPSDLGGGSFKVLLYTNLGKWTREISIPEGKLAFNAGRISKFSFNMKDAIFEGCQDRWVLVTDASTLKAGDEIIIASSSSAGSAYALSTTQNSNNRGAATVSIDKDKDGKMVITNPGGNVETLKLVSGQYSGYFNLQEATSTDGRYLYTTNSTSNNYLRSANASTATNRDNIGFANWAFYLNNGAAIIVAYQSVKSSGTTYYKHFRYSSRDTIFSVYKSTSKNSWNSSTTGTTDIYLYKKEAGTNDFDDPILEYDQYGAYLSGGNHIYGTGCQLSREYEGGTVTFAILTPVSFEIAEFSGIPEDPAKDDSFTLTYNLITGHKQTDTDYNVTVIKVDGPKVWLSDGSGNGFIVKK